MKETTQYWTLNSSASSRNWTTKSVLMNLEKLHVILTNEGPEREIRRPGDLTAATPSDQMSVGKLVCLVSLHKPPELS